MITAPYGSYFSGLKVLQRAARSLVVVASLAWLAAGADVSVAASDIAASSPSTVDSTVSLVRLTQDQYERAVRDIFGPTIHFKEGIPVPGIRDEGLLAIGTRKQAVSSAAMEQLEERAQDIAEQVVDPSRRSALLGCAPRDERKPDNACAAHFLQRTGLLLLRRPLTDRELQHFVRTQADSAARLSSFNQGLRAALFEMLVSPDFLFRIESAAPDPTHPGMLRLEPYSMASRLSFFLWNSSPDQELLRAAAAGELKSEAGLSQQVDRMLRSPRLEQSVRAFFSDLLGFDQFATLSVDTTLYPKFTKNVLDDASEQTLRTVVDHLLARNRPYGELFTTRDTFLTPSLASLYGVPLARSQELGGAVPWVPYQFPQNDPHVGILSQASFLSLNSHPGTSSPTLRGKAVREELLCQKVPPPPGNVDFSLVQDVNNVVLKTTRMRLTAHSTEAMCAGCHKIMDPMGLSLEQFDTASGFRTREHGELIDVRGALDGKSFEGVQGLGPLLRDSTAANSCFVNRLYAFGTQRKTSKEERDWLQQMQQEVGVAGLQWRSVVRRIAVSSIFYALPPATAEAQR